VAKVSPKSMPSFQEVSSKVPKFVFLLEREVQIESLEFIPLIPVLIAS
jgi:hypothetical protein